MITRELLTRLAAPHSDNGIVSVYIKVDPHLAYERAQPAMKFKGAYSRARREADERTMAILEREHDRILSFLEDWKQSGRGLAIFASRPDNLWETQSLDVMVPSYVTAANEPDTQFLVRILDETPSMAVLLLSGGDARLYLSEQGAAAEASRHSEELPSRHAQGGWSQARFQRHVDFHHSKVLREMADQVTSLFYKKAFARLVLVGLDSATKELESMLSDPIRQRVIGHLPADFKTENDSHILVRAGQLAQEQERSTEVAIVGEIVNQADAHGKGVLGFDDVLRALIEGSVDTLAMADGLTHEGSLCKNCDYFSPHKFSQCPTCGSADCEPLRDVVEHTIEYAYLKGSQVNVVFGAASEMIQARGGIGALLRYAPPAIGDQA
ncbi:MAG: Vms1/Ankzf1 family peptidyl-tRNA hydrolase [Dehalococcoidia bacterium]|nr:Vms1/Ankzf1 family peptidyl-tRNA hydrolase [Dehalococcoidia bacterium]